MSVTIKYDKYLFVLTKKNDSALSITAQTHEGSSLFENNGVELKRIKFDTVVAALSLQNQKNLLVKLNYEEGKDAGQLGQMLLSVIIKYDFLPEFSEDVILAERKLNATDSLRVKIVSLQKQVTETTNMLENLGKEGRVKSSGSNSLTISKGSDYGTIKLAKGTYFLQLTGIYKSLGSGQLIDLEIQVNGKTWKVLPTVTPYFISSAYGHPYGISEVVTIQNNDSELKIVGNNDGTGQLTNHCLTVKPIIA